MMILFLLVALVGATPAQTPPSPWTARLEALRPEEPSAYFELGEELADASAAARANGDDATARWYRELAFRLFGLAGALDARRYGRSACLALADLAPGEGERRRFRSVALLLDRRGGTVPPETAVGGSPTAAVGASEALSLYRRGLGSQVASRLDRTGGRTLLEAHAWAIGGDVDAFLDAARRQRAQGRPRLGAGETTAMLQFEVGVLEADRRPWSTDLRMTGGSPLADVDPGRLEELFQVDVSRPVYRGGHWTAR
ncbi:MAG: hypothetical protein KDA22_15090 [Phycisphaerales bacterium]|nr:hypothetical protein [Phycisphaerales bacterium]